MSSAKTDTVRERLIEIAREVGVGGALPPARTLREQLNTSNATLSAALDELAARGQIVRRLGSGVYVSPTLDQRRQLKLRQFQPPRFQVAAIVRRGV